MDRLGLAGWLLERIPQTGDCEDCFNWANEIADRLEDELCGGDEYCCYERSLEITEKVYYEYAVIERPECLQCLLAWEWGCRYV